MTVELAKQALADSALATRGPWEVVVDDNAQHNIYADHGFDWIAMLPHQCISSIEDMRKEDARFIANARTREPLLAQAVLDLSAQLDCQYKHATALHQVEQRSFEQRQDLTAQLAAMTACRDELAKIAAAREHPDRFPDFDVSLERIGELLRVGVKADAPDAALAAMTAARDEAVNLLNEATSCSCANGVACRDCANMTRLLAVGAKS